MTEKKTATTRRTITKPKLYKAVESQVAEAGLSTASSVQDLLDSIKDSWFEEASK